MNFFRKIKKLLKIIEMLKSDWIEHQNSKGQPFWSTITLLFFVHFKKVFRESLEYVELYLCLQESII